MQKLNINTRNNSTYVTARPTNLSILDVDFGRCNVEPTTMDRCSKSVCGGCGNAFSPRFSEGYFDEDTQTLYCENCVSKLSRT